MSSIILIENGLTGGDVYVQALQAQGHQVQIAQHGEEALTLASAHRPDVIVAVDTMPVVDNVPLLELLNATPKLRGLALMILNLNRTTNGQPGATRMYNRFYDDMLTPEQLVATVNDVAAKHAAMQSVTPNQTGP